MNAELPGLEEKLDTRGLYCPVPILRARDRLKKMESGRVLAVLADDPVILHDLPAYCRSNGHAYLGHEEKPAGVYLLRLRKEGARLGA
jgi:tRNA 2-thiouridine synthesizing protein A